MDDLVVTRRSFLLGTAGIIAAPAIVRVASLMPISAPRVLYLRRHIVQLYGQHNFPITVAAAGWLVSRDGVSFAPLTLADGFQVDPSGREPTIINHDALRRVDQVVFC